MTDAEIQILATELTTDPLGRAYAGMSDSVAATDLNALVRPGPSTVEQLRTYFLLEKKGGMFLYGRLEVCAQSAVGADPLGDGAYTITHITAAKTMMNILNPVSGFSLDLADSRFGGLLDDLAAGTGAKVIGPTDKTAIQAFSLNTQSRASELGLPVVKDGHVTKARSL